MRAAAKPLLFERTGQLHRGHLGGRRRTCATGDLLAAVSRQGGAGPGPPAEAKRGGVAGEVVAHGSISLRTPSEIHRLLTNGGSDGISHVWAGNMQHD